MSNQAAPMKDQNIMLWVKKLPDDDANREAKILLEAQRDKVISLVEEANALASQAKKIRDEAYLESLNLESYARRHWSYEEIQKTKQMCS